MAESNLNISFFKFGEMEDTLRAEVSGVLNLFTAEQFRQEISRAAALGCRHFVLDLGKTDMVTDAGCGVLANVCAETDAVVINAGSETMEVITRLGFDRFIKTAGSPEEAMSGLRRIFPVVFPCPSCSRKLRGVRAGRFRCPSCRTVLTLDYSGSIISSLSV